jgi:predicted transcriptional regulator
MAEENNLVELTIEVVASYVSHNNLRPDDVPAFITQTHAAIAALTAKEEPTQNEETDTAPTYEPAVTVRKSLASREHIISLIDGKPYKTLKRHLSRHGMTPAEYRQRYGLKSDYPMTAPAYSEHRRDVAKSLGLGRKKTETGAPESGAADTAEAAEPAPAKRGRKPAAQAQESGAPAAKRGRPRKAAPASGGDAAGNQPEPMFD